MKKLLIKLDQRDIKHLADEKGTYYQFKKKPTPSLPSSLPAKSPQPKTSKIINSSVGQTNVVQGQRERKKKVILDY